MRLIFNDEDGFMKLNWIIVGVGERQTLTCSTLLQI